MSIDHILNPVGKQSSGGSNSGGSNSGGNNSGGNNDGNNSGNNLDPNRILGDGYLNIKFSKKEVISIESRLDKINYTNEKKFIRDSNFTDREYQIIRRILFECTNHNCPTPSSYAKYQEGT
jgi:hypothetical protein